MWTIFFISAFVIAMVMVHVVLGIGHFKDIRRILEASEDPDEMRAVRLRRGLMFLLGMLPAVALAALLPDPWTRNFPQEKLADSFQLERLEADKVAAVPREKWQPFDSLAMRHLTFDRFTTVIRTAILPGAAQEYVAEIPYPFLGRIDFLLTEEGRTVKMGRAGMDFPIDPATHRGLYYSFDFSAASDHERVLYVRIESEALANTSLVIMTEDAFIHARFVRALVISLTLGAFLGIMIYNLALFLSIRERMYLYYLAYQTVLLVFSVTYTGLVMVFLPSLANNTLHLMSYLLYEMLIFMTIPVTAFYGEFLGLKTNFPWGYRSMRFILMLGIPLMPGIAVINLGAASLVTLAYLGVSCLAILCFYLPLIHYRHVVYFILDFAGLGVGVILHIMGMLGIMPANFFVDFSFAFSGVWEAVFLSLAIGDRIQMMEAERRSIASALQGGQALSNLNQLLGRSYVGNYVPREWHVSIVFVDVAGFERMTERMPGSELYQLLSQEMREITLIIKQHNGSIDRSLGDGLLCYFGYESSSSQTQHARDAFHAAIKIQERSITRALKTSGRESVAFPLRIGINAANVLVANLSSESGNDFTMIGSGVNLASRLNAVCSPFHIIVSENFRQILQKSGEAPDRFHEIFVSIKHQEELLKAYECNPFTNVPELFSRAEQAYLGLLGYSRKESRFRISGDASITFRSPYGSFVLSDFSMGGVGMRGNTLICRKSVIPLEIVSDKEELLHPLKESLLHKVLAEVRWCRSARGGFEHGLKFIGLNAEQKDILFQFFNGLFEEEELLATARGNDPDDEVRFGT